MESNKLKVESNMLKVESIKLKVENIKLKLLILVFAYFLLPTAYSFAQFSGQQAHIKSYIATDSIHPGSDVKVDVKVSVSPTWHINSNKPHDDFLIPSKLELSSPGQLYL